MIKKKGREDSGNEDNRGGVVHFCRICGAVFTSADAMDFHQRVLHALLIDFRISRVKESVKSMKSSVADDDDDLVAFKNRSEFPSCPSDMGSKPRSSSLSSSFGDHFGQYVCEGCSRILPLPQALESHRSACRIGHSDSKAFKNRTSEWGSKRKNNNEHECHICFRTFPTYQSLGGHLSHCSRSDSFRTQQPSANIISQPSQSAANSASPSSANSAPLSPASVPDQAKIDLDLQQQPSSSDAVCHKFDLNKPLSDEDDDDNAPII